MSDVTEDPAREPSLSPFGPVFCEAAVQVGQIVRDVGTNLAAVFAPAEKSE